MKYSANENEFLIQIKNDISKTMINYSVISKKDITDLLNACIFSEDTDVNTCRAIIQYNDNYYHLKGSNIIFHPIKFVKLLLSMSVLLTNLNFVSVMNIFCDVLNVLTIKLSSEEAAILLCLYKFSNVKKIDDENIYDIYLNYVTIKNVLILNEIEFYDTLQKLIDNKLIIAEDGDYYVVDKIMVKNKRN